jgi:transcriptional regulator with XRE-family HTH domain
MNDSVPTTSTLRRLRNRVGVSAHELARLSGVAPNTVLNAERGRVHDEPIRRRIAGALETVMQREVYARVGEARAAVTRAEVDLDAARARLDDVERQQQHEVAQLRTDIEGLWAEFDDEAGDEAETALAA